MSALDLEILTTLVTSGGVAIRVRQQLEPAGGAGDKIFHAYLPSRPATPR